MTPKEAWKCVKSWLEIAKEVHDNLGERGLEEVGMNPHGEISLRVDREIEESVIAEAWSVCPPLAIIREEGPCVLALNALYTVVIDGCDGTAEYRRARSKGRYGTMIGIFKGAEPRYGDYLCCGMIELASGIMWIAGRDIGTLRINEKGVRRKVKTPRLKRLDEVSRISIDANRETNRRLVQECFPEYTKSALVTNVISSGILYLMVLEGLVPVTIQCTFKGRQEPMVAYGLLHEAGGAMVDQHGKSLKFQHHHIFGRYSEVPIIGAATPELAREVTDRIHERIKSEV